MKTKKMLLMLPMMLPIGLTISCGNNVNKPSIPDTGNPENEIKNPLNIDERLQTSYNHFIDYGMKETKLSSVLKYKTDAYSVEVPSFGWPTENNVIGRDDYTAKSSAVAELLNKDSRNPELVVDFDSNWKPNMEQLNKKLWYSDTSWIQEEIANNRLKIHPAAKNLFNMTPKDGAKFVSRDYSISSEYRGNSVPLGIFIPAGEVVTFTFDKSITKQDLKNWGLQIILNQHYVPAIEGRQIIQVEHPMRMRSDFDVAMFIDEATNSIKIGSPYGGPVTLKINNWAENKSFKKINFKVDKAIPSPLYIHGVTTEEDWKRQLDEYRTPNIDYLSDNWTILDGTKNKSGDSYDPRYHIYPREVAEFLDNAMRISRYVLNQDEYFNTRHSVVICSNFTGGPAASNDQPAWTSHVPEDWNPMIIKNFKPTPDKIWGTIHEMNHSFQYARTNWWNQWGFRGSGEQTNNILTIVAMTALSNETAKRNEINWNGFLMDGWGMVAAPYTAFMNSKHDEYRSQFFRYTSVLYSLGVDAFTQGLKNNIRDKRFTHYEEGDNELMALNLSEGAGVNLIPFYMQFNNGRLPIGDGPWQFKDPDTTEHREKYAKVKQMPVYYPAVNLYANKQYYKSNIGWKSSNRVQEPYRVLNNQITNFKITEFTRGIDENVEFKNVKLITQPKIGTAFVSEDGNNIIYEAKFSKTNELDSLVFSVEDNQININGKNNIYYFELQMQPKYQNQFNSIVTTYAVPTNNNDDIETLVGKKGDFDIKNKQNYSWSESFENRSEQHELYEIRTKILPQHDGWFRFGAKWNQKILIKVNGQVVFKEESWSNIMQFPDSSKAFKVEKGKPLFFEIYMKNGGGGVEKNIVKLYESNEIGQVTNGVNAIPYDLSMYGLNPDENLNQSEIDKWNEKFDYKGLNRSLQNIKWITQINDAKINYDNSFVKSITLNPKELDKVWWIYTDYPEQDEMKKGNFKNLWNSTEGKTFHTKSKPNGDIIFDIKFNTPFKTNSFNMTTRGNREQRPTRYDLWIENSDGTLAQVLKENYQANIDEQSFSILFKGVTINPEQTLKIRMQNTDQFISFHRFNMSWGKEGKTTILDANDPRGLIKYNGFSKKTDSGFFSNSSQFSKKSKSTIKFKINSDNFFLGSVNIPKSNFKVYENKKLIEEVNASTLTNMQYRSFFYGYQFGDSKEREITIELMEDKEFQLDYLFY